MDKIQLNVASLDNRALLEINACFEICLWDPSIPFIIDCFQITLGEWNKSILNEISRRHIPVKEIEEVIAEIYNTNNLIYFTQSPYYKNIT